MSRSSRRAGPDNQHLPFLVKFSLGLFFWTYAWILLTRFGLLVLMMKILFASWGAYALGANLTTWYSPPLILLLLLLAVLAIYGFITSLGGRTLFRDVLAE